MQNDRVIVWKPGGLVDKKWGEDAPVGVSAIRGAQ
jgi:hypothetical protein